MPADNQAARVRNPRERLEHGHEVITALPIVLRELHVLVDVAAVALDVLERLQHPLARAEPPQGVALLELLHDGQLEEDLDQDLVVPDARRRLRVQLHEAIGVGGEERVEPRVGRGATVAAGDGHELALFRSQVDAVEERGPEGGFGFLDGPEDPPTHALDLSVDIGRHEVGPGKRAEGAPPEGEVGLSHSREEVGLQLLAQALVIAEQRVIVVGSTADDVVHDLGHRGGAVSVRVACCFTSSARKAAAL